jgi:hypothetical protein
VSRIRPQAYMPCPTADMPSIRRSRYNAIHAACMIQYLHIYATLLLLLRARCIASLPYPRIHAVVLSVLLISFHSASSSSSTQPWYPSRALSPYRIDLAISFRASLREKGLVSALLVVSSHPSTTISHPRPSFHILLLFRCLQFISFRSPQPQSPLFSYTEPHKKRTQGTRTNRIVLEHTKRLMGARPLHGAVVARHGHGDETHHYRAGLCCVVVLLAHVGKYRMGLGV